MKPLMTIAAGAVLAMTLSACELRREGGEEEPAADGEEPSMATPAPSASPEPDPSASASPAASIIREGATPATLENLQPEAEPINLTLPFPDGTDINAAVERRLAGLMQEPAIDEDWPVILSGHTDSGGNDQANLRASRARAEAVAAWLVERGVDDARIEVIAFGEQNPLQPNALPDGTPNEDGRRANRRVEIRIAPPEDADDGTEADQDA